MISHTFEHTVNGEKLTSQKLVDNTVRCATSITNRATTSLGDGVQLIQEDDARSCGTSLVKDVSDVAFRLTKPHAEQLGTLDRDEVGSALVGDSLSQHRLTGTRRTVEQDTSRGRETELEELLGVVHRVLDLLAKLLLDLIETTNIFPANVGNFDNSNLAESRGVGGAKGETEVLHGDTKRVENLSINGVLVEVNEIHLLSNLLHGSLGTQSSDIRTDVTVGLGGNLLQIDVITKLHVLGVDLENLETAGRVRNTNVDLTVETTEASEGRVDGVGTVGGSHDNNVGSSLHAVHQSEQLRDDTALNLTVGLVTLGGDRVDLINEDDGGRVLLGLLESLSQVGLRLTGHLGHDLGTVDQEEEGTGLIGDGSSHERLTGSGRTVKQDTTRGLDTDRLEELRVTQRKLNHLADLSHLFPAATNVIVANLVEIVLLILALNRLSLAVDDCVLCDDTILRRIYLNNLELDLAHATADNKQIALSDRSVCFSEVGCEENIEERAGDTLDCVSDGQNGNSLGLFGS